MAFDVKLKDDHRLVRCYTCMQHSVLSTPLVSNKISDLALKHYNKKDFTGQRGCGIFQGCLLLMQNPNRGYLVHLM